MSQGRTAVSSPGNWRKWGCPWREDQGVNPGGAAAAHCSPSCKSPQEPQGLGGNTRLVSEKGHWRGLEWARTESSVLRAFYLFSVGENVRGGFQQNIHQLSRWTFNMLMCQNEHIMGFGNILCYAILFYFYLESVWLLMWISLSVSDFIGPWA